MVPAWRPRATGNSKRHDLHGLRVEFGESSKLVHYYAYVNIGALVTSGVNGGSGWDTQVGVEVWLVQRIEDAIGLAEPVGKKIMDRSSVTLENHFRPQMEADTQGVGYQAWADASRMSADELAKYSATEGPLIVVRIIRLGAAKSQPEHIAVNQTSVSLSYRIAR